MAVGVVLVVSGCGLAPSAGTVQPRPTETAATATAGTPEPEPTVAEISIPPAAADELAPSVAQAGAIRSTVTSPASGGREYVVRGQCRWESAVGGYSYSVTVDGAAFSSADLPCDGSVTVNSLGPVKENAEVAIALLPAGGSSPGTAYVVVLPAS